MQSLGYIDAVPKAPLKGIIHHVPRMWLHTGEIQDMRQADFGPFRYVGPALFARLVGDLATALVTFQLGKRARSGDPPNRRR